MKKLSVETLAVHAGEPREKICGSVNLPIFQSATYLYTGETSYEDLKYIRLNNTPNHLALSQKLAALEEGDSALVAASGMAAISDSLLAFLESGDHIIDLQKDYSILKMFPPRTVILMEYQTWYWNPMKRLIPVNITR